MTRVHVVWAQARGGVIGDKGGLPWHVPQDLAHFKRLTLGCPVIMGRKTWDSLPERFRPLPGRTNIVVTRSPSWQAAGATAAAGLHQALEKCVQADVAWVIGGAQIYAQALPLACTAVVTLIDADYVGDAYAPQLDEGWREVSRKLPAAYDTVPFAWVTYQRKA